MDQITWKEAFKCFFGFHPRNPQTWIMEEAYYVTTCHNGDTDWYEDCPRCERKHYSKALNREMATWNGPITPIHNVPKGWRNGFERWYCGNTRLPLSTGTQQNDCVTCPDCLLGMVVSKSLDKWLNKHEVWQKVV